MSVTSNGVFTYKQALTSVQFGRLFKGILPPGVYEYESMAITGSTSQNIEILNLRAVVYNTLEESTASYRDYAVHVDIPSANVTIDSANVARLSNDYPLVALRYTYDNTSNSSADILAVSESTVKSSDYSSLADYYTAVSDDIHLRREDDVILFRYKLTTNTSGVTVFDTDVKVDTSWTDFALFPDRTTQTIPLINHGLRVVTASNSTTDTVVVRSNTVITQNGLNTPTGGNVSLPAYSGSGTRVDYIYLDTTGAIKVQQGANATATTAVPENFFGRRILATVSRSAAGAYVSPTMLTQMDEYSHAEMDASTLLVRTSTSADTTGKNLINLNANTNIKATPAYSTTKSLYTIQDILATLWNTVSTLRGTGTETTYTTITAISNETLSLHNYRVSLVALADSQPDTIVSAISTPTSAPSSSTALYTDANNAYFNYSYSKSTGVTDTTGTTLRSNYASQTAISFNIPASTQTTAGLMTAEDKTKMDTLTDGMTVDRSIATYIDEAITANNTTYAITTPSTGLTLEERIKNIEMTLWGATPTTVATQQGLTIENIKVTGNLIY